MSVRPAGSERASALAALHARAFDEPWSEADVADLMRLEGVLAFEHEHGFVMVRLLPDEAEVLTVAVAREARRRGVGRLLLRAALAGVRAAGAEAMVLEVAADNTGALALYRGEGFEPVGLRRGYYARSGAPAQDALLMRRALNRAAP